MRKNRINIGLYIFSPIAPKIQNMAFFENVFFYNNVAQSKEDIIKKYIHILIEVLCTIR